MRNFKKFVRSFRGERIDQPDFDAVANDSQKANSDSLVQGFVIGNSTNTTNQAFIVNGFATTVASTIVTVTGGTALLGYRDKGQSVFANIVTAGDLSKSINVGALSSGDYGVYVRLEYVDSDFSGRVFWDALSTTPVEYNRLIPTRSTENWSVTVEVGTPGIEWLQVATLHNAGGVWTVSVDNRNFFFEGQAANSYAVVNNEWGSTGDRTTSRNTGGVFSLYKAIRGLQRQVQDIIGASPLGWWSNIPTNGSLTQLSANKLNRDGTNSVTGNILPDTTTTRNLGSLSSLYNNIFSQTLLSHIYNMFSGGTPTVITMNSDLPSSDQTTLTAGITGTATLAANQVTVTSTTGIHLNSAPVQLGTHCDGQNGLSFCGFSFTMTTHSVRSFGNHDLYGVFTATLSPSSGGAILPGDHVVAYEIQTVGGSPSNVISWITVANQPIITASNTVTFNLVNLHVADTDEPSSDTTVTGTVSILRVVSS